MPGQPGHYARPHPRLQSRFLGKDARVTSTEHSFDWQASWIIVVLGLFYDMSSMNVCTIRHWQTSSRLVQELNVCTVFIVHGYPLTTRL